MRYSDEVNEVIPALAKLRAEIEQPKKNVENTFHKSKYAALDQVFKIATEAMTKHGFTMVEGVDLNVMTFRLVHLESGQWMESAWPLPEGAKAQELGSWITYGRRYVISPMLGMVSEFDDDGNAASNVSAQREPQRQSAQSKAPRKMAAKFAGKCGMCEGPVAQAEQVYYNPERKTVAHVACYEGTVPA